MLIFSLLLFFVLLYGALTVVLRLRPMPVLGAMPLAFCLLLAVETILLNALSLFRWVIFPGILFSHILIILCWLMWVLRSNDLLKTFKKLLSTITLLVKQSVTIALFPIVFLMLFMLLHYPPNTWDSMTYHMARVAHWIQNQSIAYYVTNISRQNEMGPGAEYIILFFQILTGTDYLACTVQFICYILLFCSLFYLLRVLKTPRYYQGSIILLTMTTPMFLFQATTTQNDLFAALVAIAIIISSVRFLSGNINNLSRGEFFLLGVTLAAGVLVKPTAVLVSVPIVGFVIILKIRQFYSNRKVVFRGLIVAVMAFLVIASPDIYRKIVTDVDRQEVYKIYTGWTKNRLLNPIKMTFQSVPWPEKFENGYRKIGIDGKLYSNPFRLHNDYVGNPLQLIFILLGSVIAMIALPFLAIIRRKYAFTILLSLAPIFSWIAFGLMVRDNPWVTRVQLPLFAMLPFSLLFVSRFFSLYLPTKLLLKFLLVVSAGFSLMFGIFVLVKSEHRSLTAKDFFYLPESRESRYYSNKKSELRDEHQKVLTSMKKAGCTRLGLVIGSNDYDYPLTWNLMKNGIQTQHIIDSNADDWSCMLYTTNQEEIEKLSRGMKWEIIETTYLWQRDLSAGFEESLGLCEKVSSQTILQQISAINNAHVVYDKYVHVSVNGNDPQVLLPLLTCHSGRSIVIKVVFESSKNTEARLYYKAKHRRGYSEERKWSQKLSPGINSSYFFLPFDLVRGRLRLDFETDSGVFIVHSFEVKSLGTGE